MSVVTLYNARSLGIHIVDAETEQHTPLFDEKSMWQEEEYDEVESKVDVEEPRVSRRQLALIYSLYLAEAIVAASLQPQLYMLLRDSQLCGSVDSAYWTGLVETVFALGSIAGLYWGWMGDRLGRRPVVLTGMFGLSISCIAMGFTNGIMSCALVRAFGGLMSSSIKVGTATMIGDLSETSTAKARNFSKLPLIATGGIIGPVLQALLAHRFQESELFRKYPIMSSQLACASLMLIIFVVNLCFLKETLPRPSAKDTVDEEKQLLSASRRRGSESSDEYSEKDLFLGQNQVTVNNPYNYNDSPKPIGFAEIVRAPSLMILLCSFSFLSLHSASFDQLLPLLGNSATEHGGLGLPCSFISLAMTFASIAAGIVIYTSFGKAVQSLGLVHLYQLACWVFPLIYIATPLLSKLASNSEIGLSIASGSSIFAKTLTTGFAQTLVMFLVTSASPDAFSLATIMGFMHGATVLRALAVAGTGVAFTFSNDVSIQATNYGLWATMVVFSVAGAAVAYFVRDRPTVRDYEGCLKWEVCYDSMEDLLMVE